MGGFAFCWGWRWRRRRLAGKRPPQPRGGELLTEQRPAPRPGQEREGPRRAPALLSEWIESVRPSPPRWEASLLLRYTNNHDWMLPDPYSCRCGPRSRQAPFGCSMRTIESPPSSTSCPTPNNSSPGPTRSYGCADAEDGRVLRVLRIQPRTRLPGCLPDGQSLWWAVTWAAGVFWPFPSGKTIRDFSPGCIPDPPLRGRRGDRRALVRQGGSGQSPTACGASAHPRSRTLRAFPADERWCARSSHSPLRASALLWPANRRPRPSARCVVLGHGDEQEVRRLDCQDEWAASPTGGPADRPEPKRRLQTLNLKTGNNSGRCPWTRSGAVLFRCPLTAREW